MGMERVCRIARTGIPLILSMILALSLCAQERVSAASEERTLATSATYYSNNNGKYSKGGTIQYEYNNAKDIIRITDVTGVRTFLYTYKNGKKVTRWGDGSASAVYDKAGRVSATRRPTTSGPVYTHYYYDDQNRLSRKEVRGSNGVVKSYTYTYEYFLKKKKPTDKIHTVTIWDGQTEKTVVTYNKEGFIRKLQLKSIPTTYRYEFTYNEAGLVDTQQLFISGNPFQRYQYTYGKVKASKKSASRVLLPHYFDDEGYEIMYRDAPLTWNSVDGEDPDEHYDPTDEAEEESIDGQTVTQEETEEEEPEEDEDD